MLPQSSIKSCIGEPLIVLPQVDSTNNYAMGQVHAGLARHGMAYFAVDQFQGKGQRGKQWVSVPGENIAISYVLDTSPFKIDKAFPLSASIALACYSFIKKLTGIDSYIKWPNDVYINDRKAGGILIENVLRGNQWSYSIVGIGLNINQLRFPETLKNPVSLKMVTGIHYNTLELVPALSESVEAAFQNFSDPNNNPLDHYNRRLFRINETVNFNKDGQVFQARVLGVNDQGQLETSVGPFAHGELEWIL